MSVRRLLADTDSRELAEWMAFSQIEPFGEWRADYRMAKQCAITAAAGGATNVTVEQFMPKFDAEAPKPGTWRQQRDRLARLAAMMGGTVRR